MSASSQARALVSAKTAPKLKRISARNQAPETPCEAPRDDQQGQPDETRAKMRHFQKWHGQYVGEHFQPAVKIGNDCGNQQNDTTKKGNTG